LKKWRRKRIKDLKNLRIYGLIGKPLSHSFSKKYFDEKFQRELIQDTIYKNFPIDSIDLLQNLLIQNPLLHGLNVTIPYKRSVLVFIDSLDEVSGKTGAVNTIKIIRSDSKILLAGYNTDVYGFRESLIPFLKVGEKKAIVLGTGGASDAVNYVLNKLGIEPVSVSRNPTLENQLSYNDLNTDIIKDCRIIINTTPVGMYPEIDGFPSIPYAALTETHLLYDLVYNPAMTLFLQKGREAGATIVNGSKMLELQAERSWEIWNG
jgi:shikimate dehydrogenase